VEPGPARRFHDQPYLLDDEPESVSARGGTYLQHNIEDVVFVNLKFRSGVSAQIQVSWLDPRKERRLTIVGSQKMVEFDDVHPVEKLRIYDKGVDRPPPFTEYAQFLSIRNGDIHIPQVPMVEPWKWSVATSSSAWPRASARSPTARLPCAWCACWKRPSDRWRAAAPRSTCSDLRSPAGSDRQRGQESGCV
jgi:hypothetical protein